jgi:hypothetical protein
VRQDYAEAIAWYRRAAERGNAKAQNNLARMYEDGRGVPGGLFRGCEMVRRAADQGVAAASSISAAPTKSAAACRGTSQKRPSGIGSPPTRRPTAQFNLGTMYYYGRGRRAGFRRGAQVVCAVRARFPPAMTANIERALNNCHLVAARLTPSQIAEAQHLTSSWKPKAPSESR